MSISRIIWSRIALIAVVTALVAGGLQATAGQASAVNCTTSHCATLQVVFTSLLGKPGYGVVTSSDGVTDCLDSYGSATGTCSDKVSWSLGSPSTTLTLTATPAVGSLACYSPDGSNAECAIAGQTFVHTAVLLPNGTPSVIFFFELTQVTLVAGTTGTGTGSIYYNSTLVSATGGGLGSNYDYGKVIQLTPQNGTGVFKGWGRDCAGQGSTCTLTMDQTHRVTAEFDLPGTTPLPTAPATPTGGAQVARTGSPGGTSNAGPSSSDSLGSPGSSVLGDTASPLSSGDASTSPSASTSASPGATPPGSDGPPWLPIILLTVVLLVGVNAVVFQLVRGRRRGV